MKTNLYLFLKSLVVLSCIYFSLSSSLGYSKNKPVKIGNSIKNHKRVSLSDEEIMSTLKEVYKNYSKIKDGKNADYIKALASVDSKLFSISLVTVDGRVFSVGDSNTAFAIESISKPFVYGLALKEQGEQTINKKVSLNNTGLPFNAVLSIEQSKGHLQNPLVNAGAIQVVSFLSGTKEEKWSKIQNFLNGLAETTLVFGKTVYDSEMETNTHNRAIAVLLQSYGLLDGDPDEQVDVYTRECSVFVTSRDLATMGATLANWGESPVSHQKVLSPENVKKVLSVMVTEGFYEESGKWFYDIGLPGKSGVGGGILAILPGEFAVAVYSPPLDEAGNSVRGQAVMKDLSKRWKLHLFDKLD